MNIDRGMNGRLRRLPELDMESHNDFMIGLRAWMFRDLSKATLARAEALTEREVARGGNLSADRCREIFESDQTIMFSQRVWVTTQLMKNTSMLDGFSRHGDAIRRQFAEAEKSDCGSIELNPDLDIPDYARHEFHLLPKGYVGQEFAGPVYHHGTNSFYLGWNDQDEIYFARAKGLTQPADGALARVLDLGSGIGQYAMALKDTYPDAEIWGVDMSEPLTRYAHARAVELATPVHFAQRLAENTKFPDGYFDVVSAQILFHEVSDDAAADIVAEAWRVLRPGGVFDIIDFDAEREFTPYAEYRMWADHHYNNEPWEIDYYNRPFIAMLEGQGFTVTFDTPALSQGGLKKYVARKPG
jgi:SAM-dependent methyltransferase